MREGGREGERGQRDRETERGQKRDRNIDRGRGGGEVIVKKHTVEHFSPTTLFYLHITNLIIMILRQINVN